MLPELNDKWGDKIDIGTKHGSERSIISKFSGDVVITSILSNKAGRIFPRNYTTGLHFLFQVDILSPTVDLVCF